MVIIKTIFKEDEVTELKKTTGEMKEAIISIVAMLNKHRYGKIIFGINDNGEVVGQEISGKTLRDLSQYISDKIEPKIYPQIYNVKIEDKDCIIVEFVGEDVPYFADGRAYIRVADRDLKLSIDEIKNIMKDNDLDYWDEQVSGKSIYDVNEDALRDFIDRANKAGRITLRYTNKKDVLNKLGVLKGEELLNAGKVLFCDNNKVELQMAIFATETKTTFIDINKEEGNILDLISKAQEYIQKNMIWKVRITDTREEIPEIPLVAIREAIINSFAHRQYRDPKGVEISIFSDRIEIYNSGTFPSQYNPDDYIYNGAKSVLRNPLIANILFKGKYTETYASGIIRIHEECNKCGVKVDFKKEKEGFTTIFYRDEYELHDTKNDTLNDLFSDTLKSSLKDNLPLQKVDIGILKIISSNANVTQEKVAAIAGISLKTVRRSISRLKKMNLIKKNESKEKGRWLINKVYLKNRKNDTLNDPFCDTLNDPLFMSNYDLKILFFILNMIANNEKITQKKIADIAKISICTVKRYMLFLQNHGFIERIGAKKNGKWLVTDLGKSKISKNK